MAVAFVRAGIGAFVSAGADRLGCFELDQLLHHETHRVADQVHSIAGAERVEAQHGVAAQEGRFAGRLPKFLTSRLELRLQHAQRFAALAGALPDDAEASADLYVRWDGEAPVTAALAAHLVTSDAAAVGSPMAAEAYGLKVVAAGIEDSPWNTTRFFVIGRGEGEPTGRDKTSILFGTPHVPGTLLNALEPLAREGVNMTRIESYPLRDRMWEYLFFVDFLGHRRDEKVRRCLAEMAAKTTLIKILGSYPQGEEA